MQVSSAFFFVKLDELDDVEEPDASLTFLTTKYPVPIFGSLWIIADSSVLIADSREYTLPEISEDLRHLPKEGFWIHVIKGRIRALGNQGESEDHLDDRVIVTGEHGEKVLAPWTFILEPTEIRFEAPWDAEEVS